MRALLDVNLLLALFDRDHIDHQRARAWLERHTDAGWASCPITENGFVRIISQPRYPSPVAPTVAIELLGRATATAHHQWWPCDVSVLDPAVVDRQRVHGHRPVTDAYLLALAVHHGGRFATFDQSIARSAVPAASSEHLVVI
jgi:hypothetical protein